MSNTSWYPNVSGTLYYCLMAIFISLGVGMVMAIIWLVMDFCYRKYGHHFAALHTDEERYVQGGVIARDAGLCLTSEERRAILNAALIKRAVTRSDIDEMLSRSCDDGSGATNAHAYNANSCATPNDEGDACCSICLSDYKVSESIASSAHCTHIFHAGCLLEWLTTHDCCPICRQNVVTVQEMRSSALRLYGEQGVRVMQARSPFHRPLTSFDVEAQQVQVRRNQGRLPPSSRTSRAMIGHPAAIFGF